MKEHVSNKDCIGNSWKRTLGLDLERMEEQCRRCWYPQTWLGSVFDLLLYDLTFSVLVAFLIVAKMETIETIDVRSSFVPPKESQNWTTSDKTFWMAACWYAPLKIEPADLATVISKWDGIW